MRDGSELSARFQNPPTAQDQTREQLDHLAILVTLSIWQI